MSETLNEIFNRLSKENKQLLKNNIKKEKEENELINAGSYLNNDKEHFKKVAYRTLNGYKIFVNKNGVYRFDNKTNNWTYYMSFKEYDEALKKQKSLNEGAEKYFDSLLTEAYKINTPDDVIEALKTKQIGAKINPEYYNGLNIKESYYLEKLRKFFKKLDEFKIQEKTYATQFLLGHVKPNELTDAITDDCLYTYLSNYKKPWVKDLHLYKQFMATPNYDRPLWFNFEKTVQDESQKHGKANKGSGDMNGVKVLYPKDEKGWQLLMPLSFQGEKAAAFYGKEGETQTPTEWCTRAAESWYNKYTDNNSHPLYIIRNWKTGKSYQMGFTEDDWSEDGKIIVHFLDQNDVKGDDIALGDLTEIPDNLLKLMKVPFGNSKGKTLYDYKHAEPVDYEKGLKGFVDKRDQTFKEGRPVKDEYFKKVCQLEHVPYEDVVKDTGRIMCSVSKGGAYPQSSKGEKISNYYNKGIKEVNNYGPKAGIRRYYFEKKPATSVEIIATKQYKPALNKRTGETGLLTTLLQYAGYLDMGVDVITDMGDVRNKAEYKNTKNTVTWNKKTEQVREATERQLSDLLMSMKVKNFDDSSETFRQPLPKNAEFKSYSTRVQGSAMPGRRMTIEFREDSELGKVYSAGLAVSIPKNKWSKEAMKIYDNDDMEQVTDERIVNLCWQLASTYNRNWRKIFQNEIVGNRMEGNYKTNMYEDVNYFSY